MKYTTEYSQMINEFIDYMMEFYAEDSTLYSEFAMTREEALLGLNVLFMSVNQESIEFDSLTREEVRDIVLTIRETQSEYA